MENNSCDDENVQLIKKLKAGSFLVAKEDLSDPNFESTLVFICQYSSEGAYGLVLNKVANMPLSEIFNLEEKDFSRSRKIHLGGPVSESQLQILHLTDKPAEEAIMVSKGIYLGGIWKDLNEILTSHPERLILFLGYSGWGAGQLEEEVRLGGWKVMKGDAEEVLLAEEQLLSLGIREFEKIYLHTK